MLFVVVQTSNPIFTRRMLGTEYSRQRAIFPSFIPRPNPGVLLKGGARGLECKGCYLRMVFFLVKQRPYEIQEPS